MLSSWRAAQLRSRLDVVDGCLFVAFHKIIPES